MLYCIKSNCVIKYFFSKKGVIILYFKRPFGNERTLYCEKVFCKKISKQFSCVPMFAKMRNGQRKIVTYKFQKKTSYVFVLFQLAYSNETSTIIYLNLKYFSPVIANENNVFLFNFCIEETIQQILFNSKCQRTRRKKKSELTSKTDFKETEKQNNMNKCS